MKFQFLMIAVMVICTVRSFAQDPVVQQYANAITTTDLKENLTILASDAMEGRETGKRGQKMAAAFLKAYYEDLGLTGPVNGLFFQPIELYTAVPADIYMKTRDITYKNGEDVVYLGSNDSGGEVSLPVIFAGNGKQESLGQVEVSGKAVVVMLNTDDSFRSLREPLQTKGAKLILFVYRNPDDYKDLVPQFKFNSANRLSLKKPEAKSSDAGVFFITTAVAEKLLGTSLAKLVAATDSDPKKHALKKLKPGNLTYRASFSAKVVNTENVLAFLEGSDKKDEVVVITSHYDHIGKKSSGEDLINNGADDDGSGTVAVMQLAKVFAQAKKDGKGPRRSLLFMNVTGEEKGLLGSEYYTQHPVFPLANTVVDLNIDMVGRRDPAHKNSEPYVYVIGADKLSSTLNEVNETMNKTYTHLIFDYVYNDQNHPDRLYYRSDHWNFAKNNIPIIFFFDGIHEDYHKPSDEVSKIEFDLLVKRAQIVFFDAWEIANREERIMPDVKPDK
jgi:hypothetical protein